MAGNHAPFSKSALRQDLEEVLSRHLVHGLGSTPTNVVAEYFINVVTAFNQIQATGGSSLPEPKNVATTS